MLTWHALSRELLEVTFSKFLPSWWLSSMPNTVRQFQRTAFRNEDRQESVFFLHQSVLALITLSLSFINMHICMFTELWKDPLIRNWKYFLNSWNYPFHWVMFKLQIGLCLPKCLLVAWLPSVFSLGLLAVSWALLPGQFCSAYFEPQGHWWLAF